MVSVGKKVALVLGGMWDFLGSMIEKQRIVDVLVDLRICLGPISTCTAFTIPHLSIVIRGRTPQQWVPPSSSQSQAR